MRLLLCCIGILLAFQIQGQSFALPKMDTISLPIVVVKQDQAKQLVIEMPYARSKPLATPDVNSLVGKDIQKIQLIYTDYPREASLKALNTSRLKQLYRVAPQVFSNSKIRWELIKQTDCRTQKEANTLFHGFVISYNDPTSSVSIASDRGKELHDIEMVVDGSLEPKDSTILRIMERNPEWDSMLVIADLTGSMSPYVGQLLLWMALKKDAHPAQYFVFFNDGDTKLNKDKIIGETGGIYTTAYTSMDSLIHIVAMTMGNGWGGDTPENNMEATLQGIKEYPHFRELIMIADNGAIPRDLSLLKNIQHPIKIILCGTERGINPVYLEVARRNKGSIHTIESDLENLMKLKEGEIITIGAERFQVKNGEFIKLIKKESE